MSLLLTLLLSIPALVNEINTTDGSEYIVCMPADNRTMYFTGRFREDNWGGEDVYVSYRKDSLWSAPIVVEELSSVRGNESPMSVTADGEVMLLFRDGKMWITYHDQYGWYQPQMLPRHLNSGIWHADATITADGTAMLYAMARQNPNEMPPADYFQLSDIYVSLWQQNGTWGRPISLGPVINTDSCDRAPFLHPDMRTLYFASRGHGSNAGSLDIYVSHRIGDGWTEWTEPVALGDSVNTAADECWYRIMTDGKTAYFSRSVSEKHYHIYCSMPSEEFRPEPIRLDGVYFATASAELLDDSRYTLDRTAAMLRTMRESVIIAGHTDDVGNEEDNLRLSQARAESVRQYLIEQGCDPNLLIAIGFGEADPIADNTTEEGRAINRRVELRFE